MRKLLSCNMLTSELQGVAAGPQLSRGAAAVGGLSCGTRKVSLARKFTLTNSPRVQNELTLGGLLAQKYQRQDFKSTRTNTRSTHERPGALVQAKDRRPQCAHEPAATRGGRATGRGAGETWKMSTNMPAATVTMMAMIRNSPASSDSLVTAT